MLLALADDLGAEGGLGARPQLSVVVLEDVKLLLDFTDPVDSDLTSLVEAVSNFEGVDALLKELHGLL